MGSERAHVKAAAAAILTIPPPRRASSTPLAGDGSITRGDEVLQRRDRRSVDESVDPLRPEMALERCHDIMRGTIERAGDGDLVAVVCQQRLRFLDGGIGVAERED